MPRYRGTNVQRVNEAKVVAGTASKPGAKAHATHRSSGGGRPAEEIVASKVSQFAKKRRAIVRAMAKKLGIEVPADVERFYDLAEAGRWDEMKELYASLEESRKQGTNTALVSLRSPLLETYGVAQIAQEWPAQQLLDYGQTILDSLRPGMVYVGGTDPGRFIPTLLNETGEGDPHIILTQNALADNSYLDYMRFLYGDQMSMLTPEDAQSSFQQYMTNAQQRYNHDQEFPETSRRRFAPARISNSLTDGIKFRATSP